MSDEPQADLPTPPENWTHGASAAYLLLGLAIIDGVLHDEETDNVYARLARHVQDDEHTLIDSVEMAWGYLQQVFQSGGMDAYLDSVQAHCFALREAYEHDTLAGLVDDLVQIAESDGDVASAEIAYIAAVSGHLGVEVSQPGT